MKNKRLTVAALIAIIAVGALSVGARADIAVPTALLPDVCVFGQCVQFTHSELLVQIQSLLSDMQNLKSIGNVAAAQGTGAAQVSAITSAVSAAPPVLVGAAAAAAAAAQVTEVSTHIAATNATAQTSQGTHQDNQVQSLYLASIASETAKANALNAASQTQRKNETDALANDIIVEAGDGTPIGLH